MIKVVHGEQDYKEDLKLFDIKQKVKNEYIFFEQMLLATSRQNIFNKCAEVVFKQAILEEINRMDFDEADSMQLYVVDNLLEYIYLICCDMHWQADKTRQAVEEILRRSQTRKN